MSAEINTTKYEMADGHTLYRWTNSDGSRWACCGYDHGPMCRRCQPVDDVLHELLGLVVDGAMECKQDPDTAGFLFKMTDEGSRQAKHVIETVVGDPVIDAVRERMEDEAPADPKSQGEKGA